MGKTLFEIATYLRATVVGDGNVEIRDIKGLDEAGEGDLTFLANPKYRKKIASTAASAILVSAPVEGTGKNFIVVKDPYGAFARLLSLFYPEEREFAGVSPDAFVDPDAVVAEGATVYAAHLWAGPPGSGGAPSCTPVSTSDPAPPSARIPSCIPT